MDEIQFNPADPNDLFELVELLGEGSYGAVYKATHKADPSLPPVAVKIIPADEDLSSLKREIHILKRCKCDYVVEFIDCFFLDNELWIVMEFCLGGSVSDMLDATEKTLTEAQIRSVCACVALGLSYLHEQHNIHRDLKAGNILLSTDGKAKLADFGVSAQLNNTLSKRKTVIGTPFWMAPEVIQESSYDGKADVWSLGITAIEMGDGMPPHFNVHPMRAIFLIPSKPAPRLQDPTKWSNELNDFIKCCLIKDPAKRIDSAGLLSHPFIRDDVALLRSGRGVGLEPIKELLASSLEQLAEYRRDDNAVEEVGGESADAEVTMRAKGPGQEAAAAAAGTLVRRGGTNANANAGRSPRNTSGADGGGTLVRQHARRTSPHENEAGEVDTGTMVRGPRGVSPNRPGVSGGHRRGASSDDHTGTLVRHRPASRRNSREDGGSTDGTVEATGTTNFTGTSNKADQNPGLQSALRYFQNQSSSSSSSPSSHKDTPPPPPPISAAPLLPPTPPAPLPSNNAVSRAAHRQQSSSSENHDGENENDGSVFKTAHCTSRSTATGPTVGSSPDTAASGRSTIGARGNEISSHPNALLSYQERKLRELKCSTAGEIQEQLKALEGQYRDDMDALHKAYATRRKELEDALQYC